MENQPEMLWNRCLQYFRDNVSDQQYQTWFEPLAFDSFEGKHLKVRVPSQFVYEYLEGHYIDLLRSGISRTFGKGINLMYRIKTDKSNSITTDVEASKRSTAVEEKPITRANKAPGLLEAQVAQAVMDLDPHLNPNYNFENFIEGDSNKLPRAVGQAIAENPNQVTFNPLFIFGSSGVGKTHLVNAVGTRIKELYPQKRVLYVSAHLFQIQYTDSVLNNKFNDFINFYQTIDVLIIDDIQEFAGRIKTQQAFFHIFNHLQQNRRQLIMTCDRPPVVLEGLEERLLTRFKWGLIAELERPNTQLRKAILEEKIQRDGLIFPEEVIHYIADNVSDSIRDLEGIVNSIMAYSVVYNSDVNIELAERVVARSVNVDKKPITVDLILDKVCEHYNVASKDIFSPSRKRNIVQVRQLSMYLSQKHTGLPYARIGLLIGKRDHSTVMHSCDLVEKRISVDKVFKKEVEDIENSLLY